MITQREPDGMETVAPEFIVIGPTDTADLPEVSV
jgi:hypothetical protein